jgi:hypothetical protein
MPTTFTKLRPARALLALAVSLILTAGALGATTGSAHARPQPEPCHYPPVPDCV